MQSDNLNKLNTRSNSLDLMAIGFRKQENKIKKLDYSIQNTKSQIQEKINRLNKMKAIRDGEMLLEQHQNKLQKFYKNFLENEELLNVKKKEAERQYYYQLGMMNMPLMPVEENLYSHMYNEVENANLYNNFMNNGSMMPMMPQNLQPNMRNNMNNMNNKQNYPNPHSGFSLPNIPNNSLNNRYDYNNDIEPNNNLNKQDDIDQLLNRNLKRNRNHSMDNLYDFTDNDQKANLNDFVKLKNSIKGARENLDNLPVNQTERHQLNKIFDNNKEEDKYKNYFINKGLNRNPPLGYSLEDYQRHQINPNDDTTDLLNVLKIKNDYKKSNEFNTGNQDYYFYNKNVLPNEYQVEKILNKRIIDGQTKYLIKWMDWPATDSTWEPIENLDNVLYMVEEFKENLKEEKKKNKKEISKMYFDTQQGKRENNIGKSRKTYTEVDIPVFSTVPILTLKKTVNNINKEDSNYQSNNFFKEEAEKNSYNLSLIKNEKTQNNENQDIHDYLKPNLKLDMVDKITAHKLEKGEFMLYVHFRPRSDGTTPDPQFVSHNYLKYNQPKALIDFYISKIKFH